MNTRRLVLKKTGFFSVFAGKQSFSPAGFQDVSLTLRALALRRSRHSLLNVIVDMFLLVSGKYQGDLDQTVVCVLARP